MQGNASQVQHTHTSIGVMTEQCKIDAQVQTNKFSICKGSSSVGSKTYDNYHHRSEVTNEVHPTNETSNTDNNLTSSKPIDGDGENIDEKEETFNQHIMPTHEITALA